MWSRDSIKTKAKDVLSFSYWRSLVVSIIILVVGGGGRGNGGSNGGASNRYGNDMYVSPETVHMLLIIIVSVFLLRIFVGYMLEVGGRKFFIRAAHEDVQMKYVGFAFNGENYFGVLKTMLLKAIRLILWTLLLIIPGIIKGYAYRFVPYILADNPNIGADRAIELSNYMTDGEKMEIFILDLSFLGWYFLGLLALCVGTLFVLPYEDATNTQLYLVLRQKAIDDGYTTVTELKLEQPLLFDY